MRIAMCTETYVPFVNGVVSHIEMLKGELEALGHKVLIITVGSERKYVSADGVLHCPSLKVERLYGYRATYPFSRARLRALEAFAPDIIHVHNEYTLGLFGVYAARRLKVPLVYSIHMDFAAYLSKFPGALKLFRRPLIRYLGHFVRHADCVLSMSSKAQAYVDLTRYKKQVSLLPNAVRVSRFSEDSEQAAKREARRQALRMPDGLLAFVYVGRVAPEKSIDVLIDSFLSLGLDANQARLYVVGGGPAEMHVKGQVKASKADDRVVFLGHIDNRELAATLFAMDCFLSASVSEMHSISMLEAMAAGLYCLIRHDPHNDRQVESGVTGTIWADAQSLSEAVAPLLSESAERRLARRQAVQAWSAEHDEQKQVVRLLAHYEDSIRRFAQSEPS